MSSNPNGFNGGMRLFSVHIQDKRRRAHKELLAEALADCEFDYVPVPPKRTFMVKTQYVHHGKGTPVAMEIDDD